MTTRLHFSVYLGFAVAVWFLVLWLRGTQVTRDHLVPFSTVLGVLVVAHLFLEKLVWRWPILHGWFVKRPDIRGTWRGELQSLWKDPVTGETPSPIECYVGVRQTLSTLHMQVMTAESESALIAERIGPSPESSGYHIAGVYTNRPELEHRDIRSAMHRGALLLKTHGQSAARPTSMEGEYWTDRESRGKLTLSDRIDAVHTRFEDARDEFRSRGA